LALAQHPFIIPDLVVNEAPNLLQPPVAMPLCAWFFRWRICKPVTVTGQPKSVLNRVGEIEKCLQIWRAPMSSIRTRTPMEALLCAWNNLYVPVSIARIQV
jgi:hypothetical protein